MDENELYILFNMTTLMAFSAERKIRQIDRCIQKLLRLDDYKAEDASNIKALHETIIKMIQNTNDIIKGVVKRISIARSKAEMNCIEDLISPDERQRWTGNINKGVQLNKTFNENRLNILLETY